MSRFEDLMGEVTAIKSYQRHQRKEQETEKRRKSREEAQRRSSVSSSRKMSLRKTSKESSVPEEAGGEIDEKVRIHHLSSHS